MLINYSNGINKGTIKGVYIKYRLIADIFLFLLTTIFIVMLKDQTENLLYTGILIIFYSVLIPIKAKWNRNYLFLFMIISFVNISLSSVDLINKGLTVANWQIPLRMTIYNSYTAKSILLLLATINMFISANSNVNFDNFNIKRRKNIIISYIGITALYIILVLGYDASLKSASGYVSNSNPLYEYSIIIFTTVWYFSGGIKSSNLLLKLYSFLYVAQAFYYGDRSAAFMMVILIALLTLKKISMPKLIVLALVAVLFSNFIAVFRDYNDLSFVNKVFQMIERGLYSDTVSYAYYSSITISALSDYASEGQNIIFFNEFLKSIFLGSSNVDISSLTVYIRDNFSDLFNRGGGIYSSHFYAYFNYLGVFISASFLGIILRKVYSNNSEIAKLYQILIVVFSLRWYLYNPITLYRSVLLIFTLLLFISLAFHNLVLKRD